MQSETGNRGEVNSTLAYTRHLAVTPISLSEVKQSLAFMTKVAFAHITNLPVVDYYLPGEVRLPSPRSTHAISN